MTEAHSPQNPRLGSIIKIVIGVIVLGALVVFAVSNRQDVNVDWVFDETETALWIVIAVSTVAGFVLGYVTSRRRA
ncbi:hypothetical protein BH23ACT3_BH23ACT3_13310 [soil metagenome]